MNTNILPILEGFHGILPSLIEIVIHDIEMNIIIYKKGNLTKRAVGDSSYLEKNADYKNIDKLIYDQVDIDKQEMRSVSIPIYENSNIKQLICINCDISIFEKMKSISDHFLDIKVSPKPQILFQNDYKEKIDRWIALQLEEQNLDLDELKSKTKRDLIYRLYKEDAFQEKNAADYVAKALKMGRATIFKYLKEWRNNNDK